MNRPTSRFEVWLDGLNRWQLVLLIVGPGLVVLVNFFATGALLPLLLGVLYELWIMGHIMRQAARRRQ